MKIGTNGLNLIKQFEGCRLTAYNIDDGKITIGWGSMETRSGDGIIWAGPGSQGEERRS